MKKLIFTLTLLLTLTASYSEAAYSLIAHTVKEGNSVTVTTTAIDTTGATLIVIVASTGSNNLFLPTDTGTNRWIYISAANSVGSSVYYVINPTTSATHTFTLTASFPSLAILVFTGDGAGPEKVTNNTVTSTTTTPGSITPSKNGALLITGFCAGSALTETINASFTISDQAGGTTGQRVAAGYLIQTTAGAANPTWTASGSATISSIMVSFPLQTTGGGSSTHVIGG